MTRRQLWAGGTAAVALACALACAAVPAAALAAGDPGAGGGGSTMGTTDPGAGGSGGSNSGSGSGSGSDSSMGSGSGSGGGSADTMTFDYSGSYTGAIEADGTEVSATDETYSATATDQNAALAQNGGTLTLTGVTLTKSGDDTDGDSCNFYGVNSILLAVGEDSSATIQDALLTATSEGSNAIFATDGATVYATGVTIETSADNSRGLDATYGGTIVASDVTIRTQGAHCASVATDRGGGYVSVSGGDFSTAGEGSPLLYSTGDVEANDVTGTATGSQIAGMEGLNTILISNSTLTSTITKATASDPVANGVIIYQSTSGDAEASTGEVATFQVATSTLTSSIESGAMFYVTNTAVDIVLYDSQIVFDADAADLLLAAGNDSNSWGSAGSNGATVTLTAIAQELEGTIEVDTISSVEVWLTEGSTWTGAGLISQNSAGSTVDEPLSVCVDATSSWVVTGDCTVSNLTVAEGGAVVDEDGQTVTIVAGGTTVVEGTGSVTVTVTGSYSTDYDASGAGTLATELIDRTGFDETFGTSTTWVMGEASASTASETDADADSSDADADADSDDAAATEATSEDATETESDEATDDSGSTNPIVAFFVGVWEWLCGLFS